MQYPFKRKNTEIIAQYLTNKIFFHIQTSHYVVSWKYTTLQLKFSFDLFEDMVHMKPIDLYLVLGGYLSRIETLH